MLQGTTSLLRGTAAAGHLAARETFVEAAEPTMPSSCSYRVVLAAALLVVGLVCTVQADSLVSAGDGHANVRGGADAVDDDDGEDIHLKAQRALDALDQAEADASNVLNEIEKMGGMSQGLEDGRDTATVVKEGLELLAKMAAGGMPEKTDKFVNSEL